MNHRIVGYGLVLVVAFFSIWAGDQLREKGTEDIVDVSVIDTSSNDTSFVSDGDLNVRSNTAPGSRAIGVFSFDDKKLVALNDDKRWPIASLSKLMTALVAFNQIKRDGRTIITKEMIDITDGEAGDFRAGDQYSIADLEKALLVVSNNAAAEALASYIGRDNFLKLMNETAAQLELRDTNFIDPTGLSIGNQSTIQDLGKLVKYILINKPQIFTISRQPFVSITDLTSGLSRELKNINPFAGEPNFIGGKTGTTPEAVGNLISVFRGTKTGEGFIIILLGTEDRFNETKALLNYALTRSN